MTKKNSSSLTEKTGVVVFARILTTIIDLLLAIAIVRILSKTDFAIIGYILMIHEVARNLAVLGFPESVFYYFERVGKGAKKGFVIQTLSLLLGSAAIAGGLIYGFQYAAPLLLGEWPVSSVESVQNLIPLIALVAFFEIPTWPTTNILLAADRQKDASWYEISTSLLSFVALIIPLWLGYSLEFALICLVGYAVIRFIVSLVWVFRILPETDSLASTITVKEQMSFSIPLGISSLVNKANKYIDKFIVSIFLTDAAFAEYSIAAQEVPIIRVIPFAVGSVLISRYVSYHLESRKEELLDLWYKGIEKVSLMVIPLTILVIAIAGDLISFLFETEDTSYQAAVLPFQIYNLIILIRVTHYGSILQAFGDSRGVLYMSLNLLVANIVLTVPMTYYFGLVGAASSTLIANIYNWYIILRRIGGHMELPARKVLPFRFYFKVLGVSVLSAGPVWFIRNQWISDESIFSGLLISIVLFLILYSIMGSLTHVISKEDWKNFREWISLKFMR